MDAWSDVRGVVWKDGVFATVRMLSVAGWVFDGWEFVGSFRADETE